MNKRMKTWQWRVSCALIAAVALTGLPPRLLARAASDRPNIMFIMGMTSAICSRAFTTGLDARGNAQHRPHRE